MARVVDELAGRRVLGDLRHLHAAGAAGAADPHGRRQLGAEAALRHLLQDDLLAAVGLAVGAARGLGVGEVLRRDVHAQALRGQAAGGDVESVEEAHHLPPIADSRMWMRAWATWTMVSWSSAFSASLADSESMSTVEPSARTAPTEVSVCGVKLVWDSAAGALVPCVMAAARAPWKFTSTR